MGKANYETCRHVENVGEMTVYVTPGCPRATIIKGQFVSSKRRCEACGHHQKKERGDENCGKENNNTFMA